MDLVVRWLDRAHYHPLTRVPWEKDRGWVCLMENTLGLARVTDVGLGRGGKKQPTARAKSNLSHPFWPCYSQCLRAPPPDRKAMYPLLLEVCLPMVVWWSCAPWLLIVPTSQFHHLSSSQPPSCSSFPVLPFPWLCFSHFLIFFLFLLLLNSRHSQAWSSRIDILFSFLLTPLVSMNLTTVKT